MILLNKRMGHLGWAFMGLLLTQVAFAQSLFTTTYNQVDGLASSTIYDIAQDHHGRLWVGTRSGLSSFDGDSWHTLSLADGLGPIRVRKLEVDASGDLWLASQYDITYLRRFDGITWHAIPNPTDIPHFDNPREVNLSVAQTEAGPMVALTRQGQLMLYGGNQWFPAGLTKKSDLGTVRHHVAFGNKFLLSSDKGLLVIQGFLKDNSLSIDSQLNQLIPESERDLLGATFDGDPENPGRIWIVSTKGISLIENNAWRRVAPLPGQLGNPDGGQLSLFMEEQGHLLVGNGLCLFQINNKTGNAEPLGVRNGMANEGATGMLLDRENGLWISSLRGLTRVHSRCIRNWKMEQGLLADEACSVLTWGAHQVLVGHPKGFSVFNGKTWRAIPLPNYPHEGIVRIMEMQVDPLGMYVYVAVNGIGVVRLDHTLNPKLIPFEEGFVSVISVEVEPNGTVWAVSNSAVYRLEEDLFRRIPNTPTMITRRVQALPGKKMLAFSTEDQGVWFFKNGGWSNVHSPTPAANNVYTVVETEHGILAGTMAGLYEIKKNNMERVMWGGGISNTIYFLLEDRKKRIWAGTDTGIFRLEQDKRRHYQIQHGLPELEMNRDAYMEDVRGNLWFGGAGGLSQFFEAYDFPTPPPSLELGLVQSEKRSWPHTEPIVLPSDDNDLTFTFNAISMYRNQEVWVSGFLEGYDHDWLPKQRAATKSMTYRNLPAGEYTFKIRALGPSGQWSKVLSTESIAITRPYWQEWWFLVVTTLFVVGTAYLIFDYFSSKRFSTYLQLQVDERTSELTSKNQLLEDRIQDQIRAKAEIRALNEELEDRVRARTAELERLQKDMVENAHYAGMAEIATSVIHNVGNILNSLSTSAYLIQDTLEHSKITAFLKANALLEQHLEHFDQFLRDDPKGYDLLRFYLSIGSKLQGEHSVLADHLRLLQEKLEAIKDVVSHQNNYTSGVYQTEPLNPNDMIEIAIKIMGASFENHGIHLKRELQDIPKVYIQKTKMTHTLVNLLKNASESIRASEKAVREIRLESWTEGDFVYLAVSDTGSGIPEENLEKIFNHGFTTKKEGHGFGLHSCANAMQEMRGNMWAENRPDGGARFVLKFPIPTTPVQVEETNPA